MDREELICNAIDGLSDAIRALEQIGGHSDMVITLQNLRTDTYVLFDEEDEYSLESLMAKGYSKEDAEDIIAEREIEMYEAENDRKLDAYLSSLE